MAGCAARAGDTAGGGGERVTASGTSGAQLRSLYVCYFGLREPLVQTQVLPYLRELARAGAAIRLLTFEPRRVVWTSEAEAEMRQRLRGDGIEWTRAVYHTSLPGKIADILTGVARIVRIARRERITIIHARSHVPAFMALLARPFTNARVLFDIRGLMADEYADAGHWRATGWLYRTVKALETFLYRADGFVVLTERARQELFPTGAAKPLEVIPCCFDAARFAGGNERTPAVRAAIGAEGRTVIVYAGSLGGAYLARELAAFFRVALARDRGAFLLVLTQSRREIITDQLRQAGVGEGDFHVVYVSPDDLPAYLAASDVAVSMVKPSYSKIAMSPTKFAEYLAAGLPVISTRGIGDLDAQIARERVGVLLDAFTDDAYAAALRAAEELRSEPGFRARAAAVARRLYDLHEVGGARYVRLYHAIARGRA